MNLRNLGLFAFVMVGAFAVAACHGPEGGPGAMGSPGATGEPGATGAPGAPGVAAATPVAAQAGLVGFGSIYGITVDPHGDLWVAYVGSGSYYGDARKRHPEALSTGYNLSVAEYLPGTVSVAAGYASPTPNYGAILSTTFDQLAGFAVDGAGNVYLGEVDGIYAYAAPASVSESPVEIGNLFPNANYYDDGEEMGISGGTLYALDLPPSPTPSGGPTGPQEPNTGPTLPPVIMPYTYANGAFTSGTPITPTSNFTNPQGLVGDYAGVLSLYSLTFGLSPAAPALSIFPTPATGVAASSNVLAQSSGVSSIARDPASGDVYTVPSDFGSPSSVIEVYGPGGTNALAPLAFFVVPAQAISLTVDANFLYVALVNGTISAYPLYNPATPYADRSSRTFNPYRRYTR